MVGEAVNVTEVPAQMVDPALLEILTDGVTGVVTVNVMLLLVAIDPLTQGALLVITHVTTSPPVSAELLYVF